MPEVLRVLLNDAQTSGGLLISVPGEKADRLLTLLGKKAVEDAAVVGSVEPGGDAGAHAGEPSAGQAVIRVKP